MIADVLDVSTDDNTLNKSVNNAECCQKATDFDRLMESVKEKNSISSRQEKIKLLTLVPPSWTIKDSSSYFGVPESMIKKVRKLKSQKGLLAEPNKKLGKKISEDIVKCILDLYQSDEYSRCCPGKKKFVSVTIDGVKCHKQKHLLLINLKELHLAFLNITDYKIGFSKFFQLHLKWCVTVDSTSGVHAVCVYTKYIRIQNYYMLLYQVKLIIRNFYQNLYVILAIGAACYIPVIVAQT